MKYLLTALALWSAGFGIYFLEVDKSQQAFQIGITLGFMLGFVAILTSIRSKK